MRYSPDPDRAHDRAKADGLPDVPATWALQLRGDLATDARRQQTAEALRARATRLWLRLSELTEGPPETLREVDDEHLQALVDTLESKIKKAIRR